MKPVSLFPFALNAGTSIFVTVSVGFNAPWHATFAVGALFVAWAVCVAAHYHRGLVLQGLASEFWEETA